MPRADMVSALKPLLVAAAQGSAEAECALGYAYSVGLGVAKDEAEAVKWYRRSASQRHNGELGCTIHHPHHHPHTTITTNPCPPPPEKPHPNPAPHASSRHV